jgi:iron complex transport system ATP-binding protein
MTYAASGITVRIGSAILLDDVSIGVEPGEIVAVAGPNGAGKTTLLDVLSGDRRSDTGEVTLDDRALAEWSGAEMAQRRSVMGTDRAVAFAFTVEEVALMGRMPLHGGNPNDADRAVIRQLLEDVDCSHLADRVFATLSTGERQRVQLARAMAQVVDSEATTEGPQRFLLLDEPTSNLDPAHQHTAMRLIRRVADSGRGVLAVLHDLNLAAAYADRVVLMREARVVEAGPPADVLRADLLESVFDIPMLVIPHPQLSHPLVVAEPQHETPREAP